MLILEKGLNMSKNSVFIATSIDGYIADKEGGVDWLHSIPNPDGIDMGYNDFIADKDAIVMGRATFETVCGFDIDWPYTIPVYVLSSSLNQIPQKYQGNAFLLKGTIPEVLAQIHSRGHKNLYIDGGKTIQGFLTEDLIDELIITVIPVLLGAGIPLFSELPESLKFECQSTRHFLDKVAQHCYWRIR